MKIELNSSEVWDLLKEGSTNQRDFVNSLYYSEFKEFIDLFEDHGIDLRDILNGGVLSVEEDPENAEEKYVIYKNSRIAILLYWIW